MSESILPDSRCGFAASPLILAGGQIAHHSHAQIARRANLSQSASLISPPNHRHLSAHPVPQEGRIAIVTDVGNGMRWTQ
jgi:hypothetical protein